VRPFTLSTSHLAKLCETGEQATPDQIAALLQWIDGTPLSDISGYLPVYSEENSAINPDELALRWIEQMCRALGVLHHGRLAHGDISPRNIIIRGTDAVLTDYDTVTPFGRIGCSAGTPDYASPGASIHEPLSGGRFLRPVR
jgi:serine/threonine protein kinase